MEYLTVRSPAIGEIEEKHSRFIGHVCPVSTEEEALAFLAKVRSEHRTARHNVFAYSLREGNITRFSDDGEPKGTGGLPVLSVIKNSGLSDVCIVVTRYFGGILLGTGGLVRAYTAAAVKGLEATDTVLSVDCRVLCFDLDYQTYNTFKRLISKERLSLIDEQFGDRVSVTLALPSDRKDPFIAMLTEGLFGEPKFEDLGEKKVLFEPNL